MNTASAAFVSSPEPLGVPEERVGAQRLIGFWERPTPADGPPIIVADLGRLSKKGCFAPRHSLTSLPNDEIAYLRART